MVDHKYESPPVSEWPALERTEAGLTRHWHIELETTDPALKIGHTLFADEFGTARVVNSEGSDLYVEVVSSEAGGLMANVSASISMLRKVERLRGPIRTINGQAREAFMSS